MRLRAFFKYFGSKHCAAVKYGSPQYNRIVEPFAGSAAYATLYSDRRVLLIDKDPTVAGVWRYLCKVKSAELRSLPLFQPGQTSIDDLGPLPEEARSLIGFWLFTGATAPRDQRSSWAQNPDYGDRFWGPEIRERLAAQVEFIRHWEVKEGSYEDCPDVSATWFVDPPYQIAGRAYTYSSEGIDYAHLSDWCKSRKGQVIVCENEGASWLPFSFLYEGPANAAKKTRMSREAVFTMTKQSPYVETLLRKRLKEIEEQRSLLDTEMSDLLETLGEDVKQDTGASYPDAPEGALPLLLEFLRGHPDSSHGDIVAGTKIHPRKLSVLLQATVKKGQVSKQGNRKSARYRAAQ